MTKHVPHLFSFEDLFQQVGSCDRVETLYQYFQGLLPEEQQKEFRKHLMDCDACVKLLAELQDSEATSGKMVLDAEQAEKIYQEGRARLSGNTESSRASIQVPGSRAGRPHYNDLSGFRFQKFTNAMLLVVVAVLAFPAYRSFVLQKEVSNLKNELLQERGTVKIKPDSTMPPLPEQDSIAALEPLATPSIVYAVRMERNTEENRIPVRFTSTQKTFGLVLSVPTENFEAYVLEILRVNETVWKSEIPATSKETYQLISVHLQRDYFKEGEYRLKISGKQKIAGEAPAPQATFPEYRVILTYE